MKKGLAAWIALGIITLMGGLLLALTNQITKDRIAQQAAEANIQARKDVLPLAVSFEPLEGVDLGEVEELYAGKAEDGTLVGYVGMINVDGYGGPVQVVAGFDDLGSIRGVSVGGADFAETAGLGAKAKDEAFTSQFIDKVPPLKLIKNASDRGDNTIDAIAAATITSREVTNGVEDIFTQIEGLLASTEPDTPPAVAVGWPQTVASSSKGYGGPVVVSITVNEDMTIADITVGDADFAETAGLGTKVQEEAFTSQFIGQTVPLDDKAIDVIAGASESSEAVIKAVNKAAEKLQLGQPAVTWPQTVKSSSKGYGGPVVVSITVNEDMTIADITVGDADFAETAGLGTKVQEEAFTSQFIGKKVPLEDKAIDVISGASESSEAVIKAVNKAAEKLQLGQPAVTWPQTVKSSSKGYGGPVVVSITVNGDMTIADITVGDADFAETAGLGTKVQEVAFTSQFIGKKVPLDDKAIDVISGASEPSEAVIKAVNKAAEKLLTAVPAPDAAQPAEAEPEAAGPVTWPQTVKSSSKGYGGPVAVSITVNEDMTIADITVGDADFAETANLGTKVLDEAFTSQFIGKKVPLADKAIDVIPGASESSEAVIKAVNKAAGKLQK